MISEQPVVNLRPMSIGEMLDRAFTVYFKNALVLTATLSVVLIPMILLSYLSQRDFVAFDLSMFTAALKNPGATPPQPDVNRMTAAYLNSIPYMGLLILVWCFAYPFANTAIIAGISRSYLGQPVRFVDCYRDALARWGNVLILAVLWIVAGIVAYIALVIVLVVLTIGIAATLGALGPRLPAAVGSAFAITAVIVAIPAFLWLCGTAMQVYISWALSFASVTIERVDPLRSFGSGFARVFRRGFYWRSFGLAAAVVGIGLAIELISGGVMAAIFYALKLSADSAPVIYAAWNGLVLATITPVSFAIFAMYYYDARIRREGFDLEHLARQLSGGEPAQPIAPA